MSRRNRFITILAAMAVAVGLLVSLAPAVLAMPTVFVKNVAAGETWVVAETTRVNSLTIAAGPRSRRPTGPSWR